MHTEYSVDELVPHSGKMSLLDKILDYDDNSLRASVTIRDDSMFLHNNAVPTTVGVEYMAQAIAAYSGLHQRMQQLPLKIGLLASVRKFKCNCEAYPLGVELRVGIRRISDAVEGLSVFDCTLGAPTIAVSATINVYMPPDTDAYFESI